MQRKLTKNEIDYVLFHLGQHFELSEGLRSQFVFDGELSTNSIHFQLSEKDLNTIFFVNYQGDKLPVLFPLGTQTFWFEMREGTLFFTHDLLKSAFYLLSAYQETQRSKADSMGRFRYKESIQKKLGIITKPVVNYYFEIIIEGLELYASHHNLSFKRKRLFDTFGFLLTHDVDRVDYYHWRETSLKWMQLLGLKKAPYAKKRLFKSALNSLLPTLIPFIKKDPWWNFKKLRAIEAELDLKSIWYFLNRDGSPHDAKYSFKEKRIRRLIQNFHEQDCEVGLHGSIKTATNQVCMDAAYAQLRQNYKPEIVGIRQHFLRFYYPGTLKIQQNAGLKYDSTMGFAEHEGFRNSYCYPFRPFDHAENRMMNIWEFPLAIMDTTLFGYRRLKFNDMTESFKTIGSEITRFGGIMVLLWHNCNFDEYHHPGITNYYKRLMVFLKAQNPQSITGSELLSILQKF